MSDVKPQATDTDGTPSPEEQEIDRRLEAKVGLGLVVLLAAAFGFMLWQKWSNRPQETYAQTETEEHSSQSKTEETTNNQPSLELEQPEPKPSPVQLDPFGDDKPIVKEEQKQDKHPLLEIESSEDLLTQEKTDKTPILKIEQDDPFESGSSKTTLATDKTKPSKTADPFGDEWSSDPIPTKKTENPPRLVFEENNSTRNQPSINSEGNPFGETESTPVLVTDVAKDNPFENPEPNTSTVINSNEESNAGPLEFPEGPTLTRQPEQDVAANENKYTEAIPLLERIPERTEERPRDSFGEFEVVPVGSSRASSTTNVSPGDFPEQHNPFATTNDQPKELKFEFPETPTGNDTVRTYRIAENDTYWKISQKAYRTSRYYRALTSYNQSRISDPTKMPLGQEILLPPERELELKYPELFPGQQKDRTIVQTSAERSGFLTDNLGTPQYRVGENDTLSAIAQRHLGRASRWIQIYELNRKQIPDPNRLKIGTVLTLPTDASNVRVIGTGSGATIR